MESPPELKIPALSMASDRQLIAELQSRFDAVIVATLGDNRKKEEVAWYYWSGGMQSASWLASRLLGMVR